jgi:hypothetical protein
VPARARRQRAIRRRRKGCQFGGQQEIVVQPLRELATVQITRDAKGAYPGPEKGLD